MHFGTLHLLAGLSLPALNALELLKSTLHKITEYALQCSTRHEANLPQGPPWGLQLLTRHTNMQAAAATAGLVCCNTNEDSTPCYDQHEVKGQGTTATTAVVSKPYSLPAAAQSEAAGVTEQSVGPPLAILWELF